jgi:prepilin-type processing-associated H-X9-DG protein
LREGLDSKDLLRGLLQALGLTLGTFELEEVMKRGCLVCGVVLGGLIVGWLVWAVGQAREGARRAQCVSHLKWIGFTLKNYHSQYGSLPPGTIPNPQLAPERRLSWVVELELFIIQSNGLNMNVDRSKGWDEPPNVSPRLLSTQRGTWGGDPEDTCDWVTCPDDPGYRPHKKNPFPLSYVGVAGVGADAPTLPAKHPRAGVFSFDRATKLDDIIDGTSQTMMVVETTSNLGAWTAGGPSSVRGVDRATQPYIGRDRPFGGYHPGGANVLMADGSVIFLREKVAPGVFEAISTIAGGERLPTSWAPQGP